MGVAVEPHTPQGGERDGRFWWVGDRAAPCSCSGREPKGPSLLTSEAPLAGGLLSLAVSAP